MWHSRPSTWLVLSTLIDVSFAFLLASTGILMTPLPIWIIALVLAGAAVFSLFLDTLKLAVLSRIPVS